MAQTVFGGLLAAAAAFSALGQALPDAVLACQDERDAAARLQCFDREVKNYEVARQKNFGLNPAKVHPTGVPAPVPRSTLTSTQPGATAGTLQMTSKVVALSEPLHSGFVVTLDNGQVWKQDDMDGGIQVSVDDTVTIKPARMGGFWLEAPSRRATKVHRLR